MTLLELLRLARKYWKLFIELPILCAVICAAIFFAMPAKWEAEATITVSGRAMAINGIAENEAKAIEADNVNIFTSIDTGRQNVVCTAQGDNAEECINVVNEIVSNTCEIAGEFYPKVLILELPATEASDISPNFIRSLIVSILLGLILAAAALFFLNAAYQPASRQEDIAGALNAKFLGDTKTGDEESVQKMLSRLSSDKYNPHSLCVISVGEKKAVDSPLSSTEKDGEDLAAILLTYAPYPSEDVDAIRLAKTADSALLLVQPLEASIPDLKTLAGSLEMASVDILGFAVLQNRKTPKGLALADICKKIAYVLKRP